MLFYHGQSAIYIGTYRPPIQLKTEAQALHLPKANTSPPWSQQHPPSLSFIYKVLPYQATRAQVRAKENSSRKFFPGPAIPRSRLTDAGRILVFSSMKVYLPAASVVTLATLTYTALVSGMACDSNCAACWKDGSSGVDIKFSCINNDCGSACPTGYSGMHCATKLRCV